MDEEIQRRSCGGNASSEAFERGVGLLRTGDIAGVYSNVARNWRMIFFTLRCCLQEACLAKKKTKSEKKKNKTAHWKKT